MAAALVLGFASLAARFNVNATQSGCGVKEPAEVGKLLTREIELTDPVIKSSVTREYKFYLPKGYTNLEPTPLLLVYHGWGHYMGRTGYHKDSNPDKYITVYLKGGDDYKLKKASWNCGNAGDLQSCTSKVSSGYCYESCEQIGLCSRCNSYTCLDDVYFTKQVLAEVRKELCIDPDRIYATGYSNGAQFIYKLVSELSGVFAAAVAVSGTPFYGQASFPNSIGGTALLHIHGLKDKVIPFEGGISNEYWTYTGVEETNRLWADVQGCEGDVVELKTPHDGSQGLACYSYASCPKPHSTGYCTLSGGHTEFPSQGYLVMWWFLEQFKLGDLSSH